MDKFEDSSDLGAAAGDAAEAGRAYAKDAVNAAGKKIGSARSQLSQTTDDLARAINSDPMKAVMITAVASSALTALLMAAMRSRSRYY